jgi:hypothetical protein
MGDGFVGIWNGFLISVGLGTIGVLCVVLPLVILSSLSNKRPANDKLKDDSHDR